MIPTGIRDIIIHGSPTYIIFVGGSQGSGKTTCSCALAAQLTDERRNVLLVSVKSHYNVSDVFEQEFSETPTIVNGFINLNVMELDPIPPNEQFLMEEIFAGETDAKRINQTLADYAFQTFHSYGDDSKIAAILKELTRKYYDFIVFDTAASIDSFGLWPFQLEPRTGKDKKETDSTLQGGPDLKNTLYEHFDYKVCSDLLKAKLDAMMQIHPQIKESKTVFLLVDTIHPVYLLGNKILVSRLVDHNISIKLVTNKLLTRELPYSSGEVNYIYDVTAPDVVCYFLDEFGVVKLPLWSKKLKGVKQITEFSQHLITCTPRKLYIGMNNTWSRY